MRFLLVPFIALMLLAGCAAPQRTSVTVGVSSPGVRMAIHLPAYPDMEPVPGYPVYYAPGLGYNYFFYDGLYWVYAGDYWYSSSWYNGPWDAVHPYDVPDFILRVPVRYYRVPPPYFRGWHADAAPRWGDRWGRDWDQRRGGWDRWDRRAEPARAPLPLYQRGYSGQRYPQADQQRQLNRDNYRYQANDRLVREREHEREDERERSDRRAPPQNIGNMPPQMRRDDGPREQPGNPANIGNMGNMPQQMQRDEGQRPAATPAPSRTPFMQEPQRREAETRGQAPRQAGGSARDRDDDERRGNDRANDRNSERNGDRDNSRNHNRNR